MMILGRQVRAARALIDMSQDDLAAATGLTPQAIRKIEGGDVQPREGTMADIVRAFSDRGLEFTDNQGVRMKPTGIDIYDGIERFDEFYEFFYRHLLRNGGNVCLNIYDETVLAKYRKQPEIHRRRMKELTSKGLVTFRILTTVSDFVSYDYAQFRFQPQAQPTPTGFYAFGDCLALMSFVNTKSPYIVVVNSGPLAEGFRQSFDVAWTAAPLRPPVDEVRK